jgi:hypothetical protein
MENPTIKKIYTWIIRLALIMAVLVILLPVVKPFLLNFGLAQTYQFGSGISSIDVNLTPGTPSRWIEIPPRSRYFIHTEDNPAEVCYKSGKCISFDGTPGTIDVGTHENTFRLLSDKPTLVAVTIERQ